MKNEIEISKSGELRSNIYDDTYKSIDGGIEESKHVFINGNNLNTRWNNYIGNFTILELGFGLGINFINSWELFEKISHPNSKLRYFSIEKHPLNKNIIKDYYENNISHINIKNIELFLDIYEVIIGGFQIFTINNKIELIIIVKDVKSALNKLQTTADAIFLDGFSPKKNIDMWTETIMQSIYDISNDYCTLSTYSVSRLVKDNLITSGWHIEKKKGYGDKKEILTANKTARNPTIQKRARKKRIAIIGGGLAGTACGYELAKHDLNISIYDKENVLGNEASGNDSAIFCPRISKGDEYEIYTSGFGYFCREIKKLDHVDFNQCGSIHLIDNEEKLQKYNKAISNWQYSYEGIKILDKAQASEVAGIELPYSGLYLKDAGIISPKLLCKKYAENCNLKLNTIIKDIEELEEEIIILACGINIKKFINIKIQGIRGQITTIHSNPITSNIKVNLHYGGYITACKNNTNTVGATYQHWLNDTNLRTEDDIRNLDILCEKLNISNSFNIIKSRAGIRTSCRNRLPMIGKVGMIKGKEIYLTTGHGSHGLITSLLGGKIITDMIINPNNSSLSTKILNLLKFKALT